MARRDKALWQIVLSVIGLVLLVAWPNTYSTSAYLHELQSAATGFATSYEQWRLPQWWHGAGLGLEVAPRGELAAYYPPHWLASLNGSALGFDVAVFCHSLLGSLGVAWLLKEKKLAVAGFALFLFAHPLTLLMPGLCYGSAWLPVVLVGSRRGIPALVTIGLAAVAVSSHFSLVLVALLLLLTELGLYRRWQQQLYVACGLLIASLVLVPTVIHFDVLWEEASRTPFMVGLILSSSLILLGLSTKPYRSLLPVGLMALVPQFTAASIACAAIYSIASSRKNWHLHLAVAAAVVAAIGGFALLRTTPRSDVAKQRLDCPSGFCRIAWSPRAPRPLVRGPRSVVYGAASHLDGKSRFEDGSRHMIEKFPHAADLAMSRLAVTHAVLPGSMFPALSSRVVANIGQWRMAQYRAKRSLVFLAPSWSYGDGTNLSGSSIHVFVSDRSLASGMGTRPGTCQLTDVSATVVSARCQVPDPSIAVLASNAAPGWAVDIDGRPAALVIADGMHPATKVASGEHVIRFEYAAPNYGPLKLMFWLSLVLLFILSVSKKWRSNGKL